MRCREIEVDAQERDSAPGHDELVVVREPDLEIGYTERLTGVVDDGCFDDLSAGRLGP